MGVDSLVANDIQVASRVRVTIESKQRKSVENAYAWLIEQFGREVIFKVVDGSG